MDEIITDKTYPVEKIWLLKLFFLRNLTLIFFTLFIGLIRVKEISGHIGTNNFFLIIVITIFSLDLVIVTLIRMTFHYSIEKDFLTLKQGIFSKQQRHIPYGVIQNIILKQDLLDKIFGLASLIIENASQGGGAFITLQRKGLFGLFVSNQRETIGFSGNKVIIPGLTKVNAEILKGVLLQKMKENPIKDSQSGL